MTTHEARRYEMLVRVGKFGEDHRDLFPEDSVGGGYFKEVTTTVKQLSGHAVSKMSASQEGRGKKITVRDTLVGQLLAISRCAKAIALEVPNFDEVFRMPRPRSDQRLLTAGRMFAERATPERERFIAFRMPADFVDRLIETADEFERALLNRESGKSGHVAAQVGIGQALASATMAVKKLDVLVTNALRDDPVMLAVWKRDRHVEPVRRRRTTATAPDDEAQLHDVKADQKAAENAAS